MKLNYTKFKEPNPQPPKLISSKVARIFFPSTVDKINEFKKYRAARRFEDAAAKYVDRAAKCYTLCYYVKAGGYLEKAAAMKGRQLLYEKKDTSVEARARFLVWAVEAYRKEIDFLKTSADWLSRNAAAPGIKEMNFAIARCCRALGDEKAAQESEQEALRTRSFSLVP